MSYQLLIEPEVHAARHELPGNMRQQVRRVIEDLRTHPRPANSNELTTDDLSLSPGIEIRRIRLDRWRIIYAIHDAEEWVWILGLYRRPPYDYLDLAELTRRLD